MAGAVEELLKKRAELTSDVAAIDQVTRLFDTSIPPTATPRERAPAGRSPFLGENLSAIVLKTIREASGSGREGLNRPSSRSKVRFGLR